MEGTFYPKNDFRNYLCHYGVKNMRRPTGLKYNVKKRPSVNGKNDIIGDQRDEHRREQRELIARNNQRRQETEAARAQREATAARFQLARDAMAKKQDEEHRRRGELSYATQQRRIIQLDKDRREQLRRFKQRLANRRREEQNANSSSAWQSNGNSVHQGANWTHHHRPGVIRH